MPRARLSHYLALCIAITIWGFNYTPVKVSLLFLPPMVLALFTSVVAGVILWLARGRQIGRDLRHSRHRAAFLGIGFFGTFGFNALMYFGMQYTTATNASLVIATMPVFGLLAGMLVHREPLSWIRFIGVLGSITGVSFLLTNGSFRLTDSLSVNWGNLMILLGVLSLVIHAICVRALRQRHDAITIVAMQLTVGALFFLPFAIADRFWTYLPHMNSVTVSSVLFIAVFRSIVANTSYAYGLRHIPVSTATVLSNGTALMATFFAILLLNERVTYVHAVAGLLIIGGGTCVAWGRKEREAVVPLPSAQLTTSET